MGEKGPVIFTKPTGPGTCWVLETPHNAFEEATTEVKVTGKLELWTRRMERGGVLSYNGTVKKDVLKWNDH